MRASDKNLTVLSEAERVALYGLPDFDDFQRAEYFALTNEERTLAQRRNGVPEQILCMLQIGYFKAKQAFFNVALADAPQEDIDFLLRCYFPGERFFPTPIRRAEYYVQCGEIARLYGYRLWSEPLAPLLAKRAAQLALRDVTPAFILTELVAFLNHQKIVRPGYTTLRAIIVDALAAERRRLAGLVDGVLDDAGKSALQQLLVREDALSGLAAIKQDAKHFGYRMMVLERRKRDTLEPLYRLAQALLSKLGISQQNLNYYASLVHYYTIYDLRRLKPGQTYLYLLCYAWQRYRQLGDHLVDALGYHMKRLEESTKESAEKLFSQLYHFSIDLIIIFTNLR